jgi:[glutamine synthetase] adenylyltransferase / [glutamine synthetase]-adenylyl-L-tyrosine phosphorylase
MRSLIASEKGDSDPWDLKLARGGLTDLDFLAQFLVLAHANRHPSLIGHATEAVFSIAGSVGLLSADEAARLREAQRLFNDVFQWQRLTVEGRFDPETVSPAIFKRLASVVGLPGPESLQAHLTETRQEVRAVFDRLLPEEPSGRASKGSRTAADG